MLPYKVSYGKTSVNRNNPPEFADLFSLVLENAQGWSLALRQTGIIY